MRIKSKKIIASSYRNLASSITASKSLKNNKPKSIKNNILDKDVFIRTSSSSEEQIEDLYLQICDKIASYIDNKTDASFLNTPIRELRKEEFEEFLPIVMAQLIKKNIFVVLDKNNILIAAKMLSEKSLFYLKNFNEIIKSAINSTKSFESANSKCQIIDKILASEKLFSNEYLQEYLENIVANTNTLESSSAKSRVIDKYLSKRKIYNNNYFAQSIGKIVESTNSLKEADSKSIMMDEILSDRIYENKIIRNNIGEIIVSTQDQDNIKTLTKLAHILLEDEKCVALKLPTKQILSNLKSTENAATQYYIINQVLSNNQLYKNENIKKHLALILHNSDNTMQAEFLLQAFKEHNSDKDKVFEAFIRFNFVEPDYRNYLFKKFQEKEINFKQLHCLLTYPNIISFDDIQKIKDTIGSDKVNKLNETDLFVASQFLSFIGKQNLNEIPIKEKRVFLRKLVSNNSCLFNISDDLAKDFPLIPRNQEQYCTILPAIVRSLGTNITPIKAEKTADFNNSINNLSKSLAKISDSDFSKISITQEYSKDDFIKTVLDKVKDLSREERQKVYDYYGFELNDNKGNKKTGFSITGYPVNLNNEKKLAQITDPKTQEVIQNLRGDVIRFSENNHIKSNNPEIEQFLNEIVDVLPELRTMIGKTQHSTHDFDVMQHSLKVMQKIAQDPKFNELNESDKKIMMLSALMHDISKKEGFSDKTHADEGSFDAFFIAKKFNLSKDEEIKLYTLIKHHEWLQYVNTARDKAGNIIPEQLEKRLQSVAYDLQQDNLFDMAMMFTHADLKAVKSDNTFHDTTIGKGRIDESGNPISYGDLADNYAVRIKNYVKELQKSQPLLPVTKIPRASVIKRAITHINPDGSTNLKGVYVDKDGLVILKYNEVEDWEALGFPKGSISKGISAKGINNKGQETDVDTGNIKFFVHGLDYANQLAKFDAFGLVDSDVLLSVSYAERPESKYRFFRPQGVILDVDTKYVHGGGNTDSGSGCGKSIADFKKRYIFGGEREADRLYISNMIKEATGMNDSEYVKFVKENENKPFSEIEPKDIREKIIKAFATINSNVRKGNRSYNEMYISNPNVMGVFAYSQKIPGGNIINFIENNSSRLDFLKKFALERDIPMIIFGD